MKIVLITHEGDRDRWRERKIDREGESVKLRSCCHTTLLTAQFNPNFNCFPTFFRQLVAWLAAVATSNGCMRGSIMISQVKIKALKRFALLSNNLLLLIG